MKDPLPLAVIHEAVLDFLKGRVDTVLFGAHAVNAYAGEPRATQDVDIMSTAAAVFAEQLRAHLAERFHVAIRVRQAEQGHGLRVYQVRKGELGNRHLVDIRQVESLPPCVTMAGIPVLAIAPLIASKVVASYRRRGRPKAMTDSRDLAILLLSYPALKCETGPVADILAQEEPPILDEWRHWVGREILPEEDDY
ncbi:nucleotidyl transferase AbiEii/AbiGii toxin family protein [bacterium]|nr:nucleotidyl transferase AbiEii/AbiGii toxin family protein [bacterium]